MIDSIATLGITVNADGAIRQVGQLDTKLQQLGVTSVAQTRNMDTLNALHAEAVGHIGEHSLSYGRLENSVASFVGHAIGVPPVIEKISVAMGHFAVGSVELAGILIGMAAIAGAYDLITKGATKAREEQEKLTQALADRFKPKTGTGSDVFNEYNSALAQQKSASAHLRILMGAKNDLQIAAGYGQLGETAPLMGRDALIDSETARLALANQAIQRAQAHGAGILPTITTHANLGPEREAERLALEASKHYWEEQHRMVEEAIKQVKELNNTGRTYLRDNPASKVASDLVMQGLDLKSSMPTINMNDGLTKEQIKTREKMGILVDDANKNADKLHDAIWGAATNMGNIIVNALNIGGGGRGSSIGGALGSTAGFAIGFALGGGPIGGAIGATVGNIAGSFFGGLFDHKKAVDKNTAALKALTAAMFNAPSGYKVDYARNQVSDARIMYQSVSSYAEDVQRRGGVGQLVAHST